MGCQNGKQRCTQTKTTSLKQNLKQIIHLLDQMEKENKNFNKGTSIVCGIGNEEKLYSDIITNMNTITQIHEDYCNNDLQHYQTYYKQMQQYQQSARDLLIKAMFDLEQFRNFSYTLLYQSLKQKVENLYQFAFELKIIDIQSLSNNVENLDQLDQLGTLCNSIVIN